MATLPRSLPGYPICPWLADGDHWKLLCGCLYSLRMSRHGGSGEPNGSHDADTFAHYLGEGESLEHMLRRMNADLEKAGKPDMNVPPRWNASGISKPFGRRNMNACARSDSNRRNRLWLPDRTRHSNSIQDPMIALARCGNNQGTQEYVEPMASG